MSDEGAAGRRSSVEVPEPKTARPLSADPTQAIDEADLSGRAIPLDATGAVRRWFRRHRVEAAIFASVIVVLTVSAIFVMRDPGPGRTRDVVTIGPSPGQALDPYVAVRKRALEDAAPSGGERLAVVSFDRRLTVSDLDQLSLSSPLKVEALALGVNNQELEVVPPLPSAETAVQVWTEKQRSRYEAQLSGAEEQLASSPSPTPVADWFAGSKQRAGQALDRLNAGTVIEGVIARGPVRDLATLQQRAGIVLVDMAPEGKGVDELIPVMVGVSN